MTATGQPLSNQQKNGQNPGDGPNSGAPARPDIRWPFLRIVLLCYLLAVPFMAIMISTDIGFNGRWMCERYPGSSLGTVFMSDGFPVCQFQAAKVLLFWTVFAGFVSPVPILANILYRYMRYRRTTPHEARVGQKPSPPSFRFVLSILFYSALAVAAVFVVYWEGAIVLAGLEVDYPTGNMCLCAGVDLGNASWKSNSDGIPVCCTLYIKQALYLLSSYSLLLAPIYLLAGYVYRFLRQEIRKRNAVY